MKKYVSVCLALLLACSTAYGAAQEDNLVNKPATTDSKEGLKIGFVNFKRVVEESKYGKLEQNNFDALKKQIESVVEEKEKVRAELAAKFNDPDYIDSLSPEAENELKHKFRVVNQELGQMEGQFYQTLNQANVKILQKLNDLVAKASATVAKENQFDIVESDEGNFYFSPRLDITDKVIAQLNVLYDEETKAPLN